METQNLFVPTKNQKSWRPYLEVVEIVEEKGFLVLYFFQKASCSMQQSSSGKIGVMALEKN